jgi:hypothetical protein
LDRGAFPGEISGAVAAAGNSFAGTQTKKPAQSAGFFEFDGFSSELQAQTELSTSR